MLSDMSTQLHYTIIKSAIYIFRNLSLAQRIYASYPRNVYAPKRNIENLSFNKGPIIISV